MLRRDGQQTTDGVFDGADASTDVDDLRLHIQVRRLQLVDGGRVCLSVFIQSLLCLQRGSPEAVGLDEDVQFTVEQLQVEILLGDADIVISDGDPMVSDTAIKMVFINGETVK